MFKVDIIKFGDTENGHLVRQIWSQYGKICQFIMYVLKLVYRVIFVFIWMYFLRSGNVVSGIIWLPSVLKLL